MNTGVFQATVHGAENGQTQLSTQHSIVWMQQFIYPLTYQRTSWLLQV